jgi:L-carnitine CoA-transferase
MTETTDRPSFGVLSGLRMVHATSTIAGPFAAGLMADMGADVIWIENPRFPDPLRASWAIEQDRRNQRAISLNVVAPEGRGVFERLLRTADVFMETSRGGTWAKRGYEDEALWEVNPALVIVHISGYGQDGDPRYVARPAYDTIIQAFSGYMHQNGYADRTPIISWPYTADYVTGLMATTATLAAVHKARETGEGESIDVAMFEALLRCQGWHLPEYLNTGATRQRSGNRSPLYAAEGVFECGDGRAVALHVFSAPLLQKLVAFLGLADGDEYPEGMTAAPLDEPCGQRLEAAVEQFCLNQTAADVERELDAVGIPCSVVLEYPAAVEHPHYLARDVFTEWQTVYGERTMEGGATLAAGETVKGVRPMPRFARHPSQVWRGAPSVGLDNDAVLAELGYGEAEIAALYDDGVLRKD